MTNGPPPAGSIAIEGISVLLSGCIEQPILEASSIYVADGVIQALDEARPSERRLNARGGMVCPGLWDAHHYLAFGDYAPLTEEQGYLARTVRCGTTTVVSAGARHLPGRPRDRPGALQLGVLSARSWIFDRPSGIKALAGTLIATEDLTADDFGEAIRGGVQRLAVLEQVSRSEALVEKARAAGLLIVADAELGVQADVLLAVNGARSSRGISDARVDWLVEHTQATLVLAVTGNLARAAQLVRRVPPERLALGTASPDKVGTQPDGIARFVQVLAGLAGQEPARMVALATGNAAAAFRQSGGRIAIGQPADLLLAHSASCSTDALEGLRQGDALTIDAVVIDGQIQAGIGR